MSKYRGASVTWLVGFTNAEADKMQHEKLPTDICIKDGMGHRDRYEHFRDSIGKVCIQAGSLQSYNDKVTEYLLKLPWPEQVTFHRYVGTDMKFMDAVGWMNVIMPRSIRFNMNQDLIIRGGRYSDQDHFIHSVTVGTHDKRSMSAIKGICTSMVENTIKFVDEVVTDPTDWQKDRASKIKQIRDILWS